MCSFIEIVINYGDKKMRTGSGMCPVARFGISGDEQLGSDVMLVTSSVGFLFLFDMKVD
jgi:hypothetical protein